MDNMKEVKNQHVNEIWTWPMIEEENHKEKEALNKTDVKYQQKWEVDNKSGKPRRPLRI